MGANGHRACPSLLVVIEWWRSAIRVGHVVQSFCRKLVWHRECLWPQDLPPSSLLVLEAADDLVPCQLARAMHSKLKHPCDVRFCTHLQVSAAAQNCLYLSESLLLRGEPAVAGGR